MGKIMYSILKDGINGSISSKRVITMAAFICCVIGYFAELFFGYKVNELTFNSMMYIVIGGLGTTAVEKFSPQTPAQPPTL